MSGSASTIVHLVRHGEVHNPDNIVYADLPGFELSEFGRRQAAETASHLTNRSISAIYASPLQRATETAAILALPHALSVTTVPDLTEWFLAQRWKGLRWDELDTHHPGDLDAYLHHPLDMEFSPESLEVLASRMSRIVAALALNHPGNEIVVVSHQDPIQAARLALTHRTLAGLNHDKPGHAEAFTLEVGAPWVELDRWGPAEQQTFPPAS